MLIIHRFIIMLNATGCRADFIDSADSLPPEDYRAVRKADIRYRQCEAAFLPGRYGPFSINHAAGDLADRQEAIALAEADWRRLVVYGDGPRRS